MHPVGSKFLRTLFFAVLVGSLLDIAWWTSHRIDHEPRHS
jgi:hypothetical protein